MTEELLIPSEPDITHLNDYLSWHKATGAELINYAQIKLTADLAMAVTKLFYPDFIEYKGAILLKYKFAPENFEQWFQHFHGNIREIETMLNKVEVAGTLLYNAMEGQDYHNIAYLGGKLLTTWKFALQDQFPNRSFDIKGQKDEYGFDDFIITFWQKSK